MSDFVHLHVHTEFSLLDGQSRIKELVATAKEMEMPAVGITDHGVMYGAIDHYRAAVKAGVKPIIGMEAYLAPRGMEDRDPAFDKRPYHMLLLAKNQQGYLNLLKLASEAQLRGYYYRPRIDRELMSSLSEGLIATSGCLASEIPRLVEDGREDEAREKIGWYHDVFGSDNFYLEIQPHQIDELQALNHWLVQYRSSGHSPVQLLATNDVHYVRETDADPHDTLVTIQTRSRKSDTNRMMLSPMGSYFFRSSEQMRTGLESAPESMIQESFVNTLKVADMCNVDLSTEGYHLPVFPVPDGYDNKSYLRFLVELGMDWRYGEQWLSDSVLTERVDRELEVIHNMGFDTYFMIVWDLCEYARYKDIWWNVRGSGAGSVVAYSLGITNVDPINNSLLFERFLNKGRNTMPDIDIDYPDDRRAEMIAYTVNRYGEDKVAAIITFGTMGAKAAVRDIGRALSVSLDKVNRVAEMIPQEPKPKPIKTYVNEIPDLGKVYVSDPEMKSVIDTAERLQGIVRHASTHAAGILVSDKPLVEYLPLHRITGTDPSGGVLKAVTQFPMETAESIGLLKVDFLGLSTLTTMRRACALIKKYHGVDYDLSTIPYDHDAEWLSDEQRTMLDEAFVLIGRGETIGMFQIESTGMQSMLRGMKPFRYDHIIAAVALYRPGPMDYIPLYNARMHGEESVDYLHEALEPILGNTYGIIVYQEQIMQIANDLFGYELHEADLMRRAVSKKKPDELKKHRATFKKQGPKNGISERVSDAVFDFIDKFANYGFNRSHATDYGVLAVQTAFLKTHYPQEYMTALLSTHFGNSDKVGRFLEECRRLGIPVLPPDINESQIDFDIQTLDDGTRAIRFGLGAVKNTGKAGLSHIVERREADGRFSTLEDFARRVDLKRTVGKRAFESLARAGVFSNFEERDTIFHNVPNIIRFGEVQQKNAAIGQLNLFEALSVPMEVTSGLIQLSPPPVRATRREQLQWERELLGLYMTGRPIDQYRDKLRYYNTDVIAELNAIDDEQYNGLKVTIAGEIMRYHEILTKKKQQPMCFLEIEDWYDTGGIASIVVFPRKFNWFMKTAKEDGLDPKAGGSVVVVYGYLDLSRGKAQVIADKIVTNLDDNMRDDEWY